MQDPLGRKTLSLAVASAALVIASFSPVLAQNGSWLYSGGNLSNSRNAAGEKKITTANVGGLTVKWAFTTAGDVSATPTVEPNGAGGSTVYVPDWAGYLYAVDGTSGQAIWSKKLSDVTGNPRTASRTSAAISGSQVIIGDQGDLNIGGVPGFDSQSTTASVMSFDKSNGNLVWRTVVSNHPWSCITSSPVVSNGVVYVGVSSLEEGAGFGGPGYVFSFRGKVVALNAATGAILWSYTTISDALFAQGYAGASVWGSTPVVDQERKLVYVGTGNNYSSPAGIGNPNNAAVADVNDHFDSILALKLTTGELKWATRVLPADTWDAARQFIPGYDQDPQDRGPDYDFAQGPCLYTTTSGNQLLGAGQKSGIYWALNPSTGKVVWSTQAGPGGTGGGCEWGSAVDGKRVYCSFTNSDYRPLDSFGFPGVTSGLWAGLNAETGKVLWRTLDPFGGHDPGAVTSANGVVFAGSAGLPPLVIPNVINFPGTPGGFVALNGATGAILWQMGINGSVNSGPAVVDGVVYWGAGYSHLGNAFGISGGYKLYAFTVN